MMKKNGGKKVWDYICPVTGCGAASIGSSASVEYSIRSDQLVARFTGGDEGRVSEIEFTCQPGTGVNSPTYVNEYPLRVYNFQWTTQFACSVTPTGSTTTTTGGGGGGGGFDKGFLILRFMLKLKFHRFFLCRVDFRDSCSSGIHCLLCGWSPHQKVQV